MQHFLTLVDAHVHIHPRFDINNFIKAAFENFENSAAKIDSTALYTGVLCLTESSGVNYFEKLVHLNSSAQWKIIPTLEDNSLYIQGNNDSKIAVIAGRQIVTDERLEVLGLGLNEKASDGNKIEDVIKYVVSKNALAVIPWGAGKWTGSRAKIVSKIIDEKKYPVLFLGDNGNRPAFWERSPLFKKGDENNIKNLPGTDPLPFQGEEKRAGSYGIYLNEKISGSKPFEDLKIKLTDSNKVINEYGRPEKLSRFIINQVRMQIIKRKTN